MIRRAAVRIAVLALLVPLSCGAVASSQPEAGDAALWRSLALWSGWSSQRLQDLRTESGAADAEGFAVTMVVAIDLGVNARALAEGAKRGGLVGALRAMGISSDTARREVRAAERMVRGWRRQPPVDAVESAPSG